MISIDSNMLTARQKALYDFIVEFRRAHGCSPSIPEIQKAFLIRSPNGVVGHLLALEAKGYIRRSKRGSRQIDLPGEELEPLLRTSLYNIPLFTQVPAPGTGATVKAEGYISLDKSALGFEPLPGSFALRVPDNSMRTSGILAGDIAVAEPDSVPRSGHTLVARRKGKTILVKLAKDNASESGANKPRTPPALEILGVVRTVVRQLP